MNKVFTFILTLFILSGTCGAQDIEKIFDSKQAVTWLGIDFSQTRFTGDHYKFISVAKTKDFVESLNLLMISEKSRYDVATMLHKWPGEVKYQLNVAMEHNAALDLERVMADSLGSHFHISPADVEGIVESYDFKGLTGVGMIFIVETLNKTKSEASVWVTFVNMETKSVVFKDRMLGEPGGFGLRNFWAGAIREIMGKIRNSSFSKWKKEAMRQPK